MDTNGGEIKLEMTHVSKWFPGVRALNDVSFRVRKGTVHVLCGENGAGKSTLMKVLDGIYQPDEGEIRVDGKIVKITDPIKARKIGIAMIFQELSYVPDLTVAENICLGSWPMKQKGRIDWDAVHRDTEKLLKEENLTYSYDTLMRSLSVSDIQMIEVLKAVSHHAKIIIMDEPTSALSNREVEWLFKKINQLKQQGVSIIYISHKLDEVFKIADEITVLRDGSVIDTKPIGEVEENKIIELMVGRKIDHQYPKESVPIGKELMKVEHFSSGGLFQDINFNLMAGEIVGFAGLMGAGRSEIMRALVGLDPHDAGTISLQGKPLKNKNVRSCANCGVVMLSEDRRRDGIIPVRSVLENTSLAALEKFFYGGRRYAKKEQKAVRDICQKMNVKTPTFETPISNLSGGNQQKVILGKWLLKDPTVLILDEPTRGIDVGAKNEIYQLMVSLVKEGRGIIMVSSELPELIGMCDRIYVIYEGKISGMLSRNDNFTQEAVMKLAVNKQ